MGEDSAAPKEFLLLLVSRFLRGRSAFSAQRCKTSRFSTAVGTALFVVSFSHVESASFLLRHNSTLSRRRSYGRREVKYAA